MKNRNTNRLLIAFLILLGITLALVAVVLGLWLHGQSALRTAETMPQLPLPTPESGETEPETVPDGTVLDSHTVCYNGEYYRYNEDMVNILLLGVDAEEKPAASGLFGDANQADVLILAALDFRRDRLTLISISRDAMVDLELLDETGTEAGTGHAQLALSFSYGDGLQRSCELTRDAVSGLFYGLPIQGYGALYLGGLPVLNDAAGGVTLTVAADFPYAGIKGCESLIPGTEVTLTGAQARKYIQARESTTEGNNGRMQRQKQYILALLQQVRAAIREKPTAALDLYSIVSDYTVTDLSLDRLLYLATEAASLQFDGEVCNVPGESVLGSQQHAEYRIDETGLSELMLRVFYEKVEP